MRRIDYVFFRYYIITYLRQGSGDGKVDKRRRQRRCRLILLLFNNVFVVVLLLLILLPIFIHPFAANLRFIVSSSLIIVNCWIVIMIMMHQHSYRTKG